MPRGKESSAKPADISASFAEISRSGKSGETAANHNDGTDDDGDQITTCIIESIDAPAGAKAQRLSKKEIKLTDAAKTGLKALHQAIGEVGDTPPTSNHIPANVKAVTIDQWREYAYRSGVSGSSEPRARQAAFARACERLVAAQRIAIWEPYVWIV